MNGPADVPPVGDLASVVSRAESRDADAQCQLGVYYSEGMNPPDHARALEWFRRAADQGHAEAQRRIGRLYDFLDPARHDPAEAARWYELAVAQGDVVAENNLAMLLQGAEGVPRDPERAISLLKKAADAGYARAAGNLRDAEYEAAFFFGFRKDADPDCEKSLYWLRRAAERGHPGAFFDLGWDYANGHCVVADRQEAARLWRKGMALGSLKSMVELGTAYLEGAGVEKDYEKARDLLERAAQRGDATAACNLGWMYDEGLGVPADPVRAFGLYQDAAEADFPQCQVNVAIQYRDGRGTAKDLVKAYIWYRRAAELGMAGPQGDANELARELTPTQIEAAEKQVAAAAARKPR